MTDGDESLLLEIMRQLRQDFAAEREASRESRAGMHSRLDEMAERMGRIDTTIALSGAVDAQVRTELDQFKRAFKAHQDAIAPTIDEWKQMRAIGLGIVTLIGFGGAAFGAGLIWFGNTLAEWVRAWLHLPPIH